MKLQKIISTSLLLITISGWNLQGASYQDFSEKRIFTGTVTPLITQTMQYGFNDAHRGYIDYTARPGSFFHGPIYDAKGNIIEPGDIIIHIIPNYRQAMVRQWEANVEAAKAAAENCLQILLRDEKTIKTHAISEVQYYTDKANYLTAIATLQSDIAQLEQAKALLDVCTYRAQYDGYVNKVMMPSGYCAGESPVIQISQITPIGINIKMDRALAAKMTLNTPVTVYPIQPRGKATGILHGSLIFNDDGSITLASDNLPVLPPAAFDENGKQLPLVSKWGVVIRFRNGMIEDPSSVSVAINTIAKDKNGDYVLRLKNNQNLQPGKGTNYVSIVEKVPIVVGKQVTGIAVNYEYIKVSNSNLKEGDVLAIPDKLPKGVVPGSKICLLIPRYTYMPGDTVKVEIGPQPDTVQ